MDEFREMQDAGFIKVQRHPEFPDDLAIANYTHKTQEHYHWNDVTEQCRGLIFHPGSLDVIARPFRKFYNYDESRAPKIDGGQRVTAYDKIDGSLGILYRTPDGEAAIATRGSFTSDQALWATNWIRSDAERYEVFRENAVDWSFYITDLFEIVYPENRIVVSYDYEGLVYLMSVDTQTGRADHGGDVYAEVCQVTTPLFYGNFGALFNEPERENAEGYVVFANDITGQKMVKVKYEEYVRLHRIVSNLSRKSVWEAMTGPFLSELDDLVRDIPEEHEKWVREVGQELFGEYMSLAIMVNELNQQTMKLEGRKAKAVYATQESGYPKAVQSAFFAGLDGKSYVSVLWNAVKPKGDE
jgi:RNA ligase